MFKDMAPPILVSFIEEKHKIFDVITLVRQGKGYTDFFSFGLPEKCSAAAGYYAMILRDLEAFVADFLNSARSIMNSTEKHFVPFVEHKSDDFFLPPYNPAGYVLKGRKGQVSITHEEFILLHLIHQGKTKSEISKILSFPAYQIDYLITLLTKKTGYPLYILKPSMVKSCYTADSGNDIPSFWKDAPGEREYRAALS
ncbi:MAG: hypothetical protein FJX71_02830 [Alphaproteobacteria bacterium]|nr:hypothetical protein [Alphaproteobacteria bacterium]